MVDITPLVNAGSQIVQGYGSGFFRVGGQTYNTPLVVFPDRTEIWDFTGALSAARPEDFAQIFNRGESLDIALLGSGAKIQFLPPALRQGFSENGIALEIMDTGAACRTYNVLLAEGRRVAALLIPL